MSISHSARRLKARLGKLSGENKKIARDITLVAGFALAAKLVAALKEMAIAWRYGVSDVVDAYLFVFNLVTLPVTIWYSVLMVVFIPLAARLRAESPAELGAFRSELFGAAILAGGLLGLLGWAALVVFFQSSASGLSDGVRTLALGISPFLSMLIPLGIATHWGSVQMMADGRHGNTLFEGVPAFVLLLTVILISSNSITSLIWGTIVGAIAHLAIVLAAMAKQQRFDWPRLSMRSPAWRLLWGGMGIMLVGQVLQTLTGIVDQLYAAHLEEGAIATLGYATRILSLGLTLGATAVARAALPVFSSMYAQGEGAVNSLATKWAHLMFGAGLAVLVIAWPAAQWAIEMLFERGAFTAADTLSVTTVLRYGLTQLPFHFAAMVIVYALLSRGRYRAVAAIAMTNLVSKVVFAALLVPSMGVNGLMLSTTAMYFASYLLSWRLLRRDSGVVAG